MKKLINLLAGLCGLAFLLASNDRSRSTNYTAIVSAINAIAQDAMSCSFDSSKVSHCKKIFSVCKSEKATDGEIAYAIDKMREIAKTCSFDSSKKEISDLITKLIFEEE